MAVTKVVMPKLSEQMETGKIIKWLKNEGDRIQSGDILAEVETDKADVEMEAFGAGVLRKILVPAGERAPVGTLIGVIAEPNDDIAGLLSAAPPPAVGAPAASAQPAPAPAVASAQPAPAATTSDRPAAVPPQPRSEDPVARQPAPSTGPAAPAERAPAAAMAPAGVEARRPEPAQTPAAGSGG